MLDVHIHLISIYIDFAISYILLIKFKFVFWRNKKRPIGRFVKIYKSGKSSTLSILFNCSIASFLVAPIILPCFVFKFKKKNPPLDTTIAEVLSLLNIGVVKSKLLLLMTTISFLFDNSEYIFILSNKREYYPFIN